MANLLILALVLLPSAVLATPTNSVAEVRGSADAILRCQDSEGLIAIREGPKPGVVSPYFASLTAVGLLRAYQATHDPRYLDGVLRYVDWFAAHQNSDGTIFDFDGQAGAMKPTGDFDSTDSYASTFISLVREVYAVTRDRKWLAKAMPAALRSLSVIELTLEPDGLTWAKPKYKVKFLMDNVEVRAGFLAALDLAKATGDRPLADHCRSLVDANTRGVLSLWDPRSRAFHMSKREDGSFSAPTRRWCFDGMAEAMELAYVGDRRDRQACAVAQRIGVDFVVAPDLWYFAATHKYGFAGLAGRSRDALGKLLADSLSHAAYIRCLVPQYDAFIFETDPIRLPASAAR